MDDTNATIQKFVTPTPSRAEYWRAIVLFGRNVASYKFALAKSLLDLRSRSGELIYLEELAVPFARHICEHLGDAGKQTTSPTSRFLDSCLGFNRGEVTHDALIDTTVRLGFNNVIDAFHNVNQLDVPLRFFTDARKRGAIQLTDDLIVMSSTISAPDLSAEVEARWRLVERAWELRISRNVVGVGYDEELQMLVAPRAGRRVAITSCRDALNGYQNGKCFYCERLISLTESSTMAEVDHFFPHCLAAMSPAFTSTVNGVWNLVLACGPCNRGAGGKFSRVPALPLLTLLHRRNEYLIASHHPLRETILAQTGTTEQMRRGFLQARYSIAHTLLIQAWSPIAL